MWKLRYYWPLASFIVPSAVIGYGFVLPRQGLTGLNELSLGFAATLVGAAITYAVGIAGATRTVCPASKPFRVRLNDYINSQAAHPRGIFGHLLGRIWKHEHAEINAVTLDLLELRPGFRVLDIGSGPGEALRELEKRGCTALGLDASEVMIGIAGRRNASAVSAGRIVLRKVTDGTLGLEPNGFDGVLSVHCLYFWGTPDAMLSQIFRALRPGGKLVLAFIPESPQVPGRLRGPRYRFYTTDEIKQHLAAAGFSNLEEIRRPNISPALAWIFGAKP